jgi:hypothetical protein
MQEAEMAGEQDVRRSYASSAMTPTNASPSMQMVPEDVMRDGLYGADGRCIMCNIRACSSGHRCPAVSRMMVDMTSVVAVVSPIT